MTHYGIDPRNNPTAVLDFRELFGSSNPIVLEIGSGKGRFLVDTALARPDVNVLGVELSLHYYRVIADRLERRKIENARIVNYDGAQVVERLIPPASIAEIHIYFPDPWPRPRERKRRLIRPSVCDSLRKILAPSGTGWFVTDYEEYFEKAAPLLEEFFETEAGPVGEETPPRTNYEAKYRVEGRPIYEVRFRHRSS